MHCAECGNVFQRCPSHINWNKTRKTTDHPIHYFCSNKCKGKFNRGANSPFWIHDRSLLKNNNHSIRYSTDMKEWRKSVFERDNYTCKLCGNRSGAGNCVTLNAHHIRKFSKFPALRFALENGVTLCEPCHKTVYGKEDEFIEQFELLRTSFA